MSFFSFGDLPTVQTRKALLLLDFQNDFVRPAGALHVANTADILETLPALVAAFRRVGDVIWVRSQYDSPQGLHDWNFGDRIVLEKEPPKRVPVPSSDIIEASSDRDSPEPVDQEAFLSGSTATCCSPQTPGFQFPAPILAALDRERDTVLDKAGYSALESEGLVFSFRSRFITELYLCGSLSNVSVYATACDAVRNGFSVTLIEDCLGYRDFQRHQEAMRRMADILGATGLDARELTQELDWHETHAIAKGDSQSKPRTTAPSGIEGFMNSLGVQADETIPEENTDEDMRSLTELASLTRSHRMTAAGSQPRSAVEGKKHVRARVRRPKRREPTPDPTTPNGRPGSGIGEGDSRLIPELDLPADIFENIRAEVSWQKMYHLSGQVPRLVAVQGSIEPDGSLPIYRHPADESPPLIPFTPAINQARVLVERVLGHPLNHALIQLYRDGNDSISEHSDKTLDITRGSYICNVSLGAQRVLVLRTKASASDKAKENDGQEVARATQRVTLPHRSLFVLGEKTNMRWLHGIRPDKRPDTAKAPEDKAYGGERISITFRHIATYVDPAANLIWGQGAVSKSRDNAGPVIHGNAAETERLIHAFGQENRATEFDWNGVYGGGFDVVNFVTTTTSLLALSGDEVADFRVHLALRESGIRYEASVDTNLDPTQGNCNTTRQPTYTDANGNIIVGDLKILAYLSERTAESTPGNEVLRGGSHIPWIEEIFACWRKHRQSNTGTVFDFGLNMFDRTLAGQHYLGGAVFGIDDCALWPLLREISQTQGPFDTQFPNLAQYYQRVEKRGVVRSILEELR